jgi:hypothetical protein
LNETTNFLSLKEIKMMNWLETPTVGETEDDIHDHICSNYEDDYHGLDSDRDTEAEVETAIRFFHEVLSRKLHRWVNTDGQSVEEYHSM